MNARVVNNLTGWWLRDLPNRAVRNSISARIASLRRLSRHAVTRDPRWGHKMAQVLRHDFAVLLLRGSTYRQSGQDLHAIVGVWCEPARVLDPLAQFHVPNRWPVCPVKYLLKCSISKVTISGAADVHFVHLGVFAGPYDECAAKYRRIANRRSFKIPAQLAEHNCEVGCDHASEICAEAHPLDFPRLELCVFEVGVSHSGYVHVIRAPLMEGERHPSNDWPLPALCAFVIPTSVSLAGQVDTDEAAPFFMQKGESFAFAGVAYRGSQQSIPCASNRFISSYFPLRGAVSKVCPDLISSCDHHDKSYGTGHCCEDLRLLAVNTKICGSSGEFVRQKPKANECAHQKQCDNPKGYHLRHRTSPSLYAKTRFAPPQGMEAAE